MVLRPKLSLMVAVILITFMINHSETITFGENDLSSSEETVESDSQDSELDDVSEVSSEDEDGISFEGDILLDEDQHEFFSSNDTEDDSGIASRVGLLAEQYRWPKSEDGKVYVPYTIHKNYSESFYSAYRFF
jgi:hypothetical protein